MTNEEMLLQISEMLEAQIGKLELKIENEVTKKIESLFDGYKLTHEKQWEMERKIDQLESRIEKLEARAG